MNIRQNARYCQYCLIHREEFINNVAHRKIYRYRLAVHVESCHECGAYASFIASKCRYSAMLPGEIHQRYRKTRNKRISELSRLARLRPQSEIPAPVMPPAALSGDAIRAIKQVSRYNKCGLVPVGVRQSYRRISSTSSSPPEASFGLKPTVTPPVEGSSTFQEARDSSSVSEPPTGVSSNLSRPWLTQPTVHAGARDPPSLLRELLQAAPLVPSPM